MNFTSLQRGMASGTVKFQHKATLNHRFLKIHPMRYHPY